MFDLYLLPSQCLLERIDICPLLDGGTLIKPPLDEAREVVIDALFGPASRGCGTKRILRNGQQRRLAMPLSGRCALRSVAGPAVMDIEKKRIRPRRFVDVENLSDRKRAAAFQWPGP